MEYYAGMKVWIHKREKGGYRRKGHIVAVHSAFVCIWITSKADEKVGWRECFFFDDISPGLVEVTLRVS